MAPLGETALWSYPDSTLAMLSASRGAIPTSRAIFRSRLSIIARFAASRSCKASLAVRPSDEEPPNA